MGIIAKQLGFPCEKPSCRKDRSKAELFYAARARLTTCFTPSLPAIASSILQDWKDAIKERIKVDAHRQSHPDFISEAVVPKQCDNLLAIHAKDAIPCVFA